MSSADAALEIRTGVAPLEQLMAIWSRVLRVSSIARDSNFFDLGGDSLLAVGLFLEVEQAFGVKLPITTIYDASTPAELAELIAANAAPEFSPLVLLKPGTAGVPLFIVHGIGGTVIELAALGRMIRIPEPVYALQAQGIDGLSPPRDTVEAMTGLYLDCIRQVQPHGPYWLCGYSFGGLIALEMARRLAAGNEEVAQLILVDAYAHPRTWPFVSRVRMRARRALFRLSEFARQPLKQIMPLLIRQAGAWLSSRHRDPDASRRDRLHDWLLDHNSDLPLALLRVREAGGAALVSYRPNYYPGRITFLKAAQRDVEFPDDPQPIWRPLVQELCIHTVPGRHRTIVTEHASDAAARLTTCILKARQRRARQAGAHVGTGPGSRTRQESNRTPCNRMADSVMTGLGSRSGETESLERTPPSGPSGHLPHDGGGKKTAELLVSSPSVGEMPSPPVYAKRSRRINSARRRGLCT
ncbi:MAG TPA: thioesterase domain-containing protein [Rhizomicrobium sp.]|jgi:acetoacetyl-CoA synthetase|nr:thioesterase domain-containing protein [Rhizomicrobium sp.]